MIQYPGGTKLVLLTLSLPGLGFLAAAAAAEGLPPLDSLIVPVLIIILLVILNGLFVMAEFAIISVRPTQLEQMANDGHRIAKSVLPIARSPIKQGSYTATAQLGITVASLGLGMYGEPQIAHFIEPYLARLLGADPHEALLHTIGYIVSVSLLTYLHIVFGEMIPKSLALATPVRAVIVVSQPMRFMHTVFDLPIRLLNGVGFGLLRLLRIPPVERGAYLHTPEELELIVSESAEKGLLNEAEEAIIRNIFDFAERQVDQVMTPRPKVQAIPHDMPLPDLLKLVTESHYSRFPVYEKDPDHIIGILHLKDLIRHQRRMKGNFDMRLLLHPAPVVPENYPVEKLLATFKRRRIHIAIVLDEFGGTAGIVTLEDLVEEVVGEVRDEFDLESEPIVQRGPGVLEVAGNFLIDDLEEHIYLGDKEDLPDVETVGGLIMTELGRLPQAGDEFTYRDHINFTVLAVDGLAVARARIEFPVPAKDEKDVAGDKR